MNPNKSRKQYTGPSMSQGTGFCDSSADVSPPKDGAGFVTHTQCLSPRMCPCVTPGWQQAAKPARELCQHHFWVLSLGLMLGRCSQSCSRCSCRAPAAPEVAGKEKETGFVSWSCWTDLFFIKHLTPALFWLIKSWFSCRKSFSSSG